MTILLLIVVLGVVIFVHELGHFLAAKANGVQVLRFSIGFGPPLLQWRRGETEYWISAIPLGGYVKMAGVEEEELSERLEGGKATVPVDPARALDRKPVWARLIVMLAGVTMNFVLAYTLYAGIAAVVGAGEPAMMPIDAVSADSLPPEARALAALAPGDSIVVVNGQPARSWRDLAEAVVQGGPTLRLDLAGRAEPVIARLPEDQAARIAVLRAITPRTPPRIGIVVPGDPAHRAGLRPGDVVARIDGDTVRSWADLVTVVRRSPGDTLRLTVVRDGAARPVRLVPRVQRESDAAGGEPGRDGVIGAVANVPVTFTRMNLGEALVLGVEETVSRTGAVLAFLKGLVFGRVSVREIGGPVLIAQISSQAAELGFVQFLEMLAFISINLAVLNLLPIPMLDGGHVVFLLIEAVRRRPLSLELRVRLSQVGFVVLLVIMVLALSNDLLRQLR